MCSLAENTFRKSRTFHTMKGRETKEITASAVDSKDADTLQDFITGNAEEPAPVHADASGGYNRVKQLHECFRHSVSKPVKGIETCHQHLVFPGIFQAGLSRHPPPNDQESPGTAMSASLLAVTISVAMTPLPRCSGLSETWMASSCLIGNWSYD